MARKSWAGRQAGNQWSVGGGSRRTGKSHSPARKKKKSERIGRQEPGSTIARADKRRSKNFRSRSKRQGKSAYGEKQLSLHGKGKTMNEHISGNILRPPGERGAPVAKKKSKLSLNGRKKGGLQGAGPLAHRANHFGDRRREQDNFHQGERNQRNATRSGKNRMYRPETRSTSG